MKQRLLLSLAGGTALAAAFLLVPGAALAVASPTVTVTIDKYIDGKMATSGSATASSFPMASSWSAQNIGSGSGTYALGPTGFNSPNAYEAVTADMTSGASYATNEQTNGNVVGASCADGKPYALVGYTTGDTKAAAAAATPSPTSPSLTNITANKYVIVWNRACLPAPVNVSPANNATLTTATWTKADWTDVSDPFPPIRYYYESSNSSTTNADGSLAAPVYQSGALSVSEIPTTGTPPGVYWWHARAQDADGNLSPWSTATKVTVDNTPPPPPQGNLTVRKVTSGGDGTFSFTGDGGIGAFQITTVNGVGSRSFNLDPGTYHITEATPPQGWVMDANGCNPVGVEARTNTTCTVSNTRIPQGRGQIDGTKYEDLYADGRLVNADHNRLAGWTVYLDINNNGRLDPNELSAVTDTQGYYKFVGLGVGTYHIREVLQPGWTQSYPASGSWTRTLQTNDQIAHLNDFGNWRPGSLSGTKYEDVNGNVHRDPNDGGLGGWTIQLVRNNNVFASTVTDKNGNYSFSNVLPGPYTVREVPQQGWAQYEHPPGTVWVGSGGNTPNVNFGNRRTAPPHPAG